MSGLLQGQATIGTGTAQSIGLSIAEAFLTPEAKVPAGHAGEPYEMAGVVEFLASLLASNVNGAGIEVTGGRGI